MVTQLPVACVAFALIGCGRFGFTPYAVGPTDGTTGADGVVGMIPGCEVPSAGGVACYSFEGNGLDSVGGDNATTTAVTYGTGRVGQAVQLGASSMIVAANKPTIHLTTAGTISAWILVDSLPATGARSVVLDTNSYGMAVLPTGDIECFYTGTDHTFAAAITPGGWTHVACAYDGSAVTLWKDGAVVQSQADSGPVLNSVSGLQIGSNIPDVNHPNADLFIGMLDEVGIWKVALTTAEVRAAAGSC